jgi:hypothetical protein
MHDQAMEWYVESTSNTIYRHTEGVWLRHQTSSTRRMRFSSEGVGCDKPERVTHIVDTIERLRYIELTGLKKICEEVTRECCAFSLLDRDRGQWDAIAVAFRKTRWRHSGTGCA